MTRQPSHLTPLMLMIVIAIGGVAGAASSAAEDASPRSAADSSSVRTAESTIDINGGFETGDFTGWQVPGPIADVAVISSAPPPVCFQPDMPSEGTHMACLSTGTFFGGVANGDVRSDLTSDPITLPFKPARITLTFTVDFQTEEAIPSIAFNDAFQARLVTRAGTFVVLQIDTFGRTSPAQGLRVIGFTDFSNSPPGCALNNGQRTGKLTVTWTKNVDALARRAIGTGPVYLEFSISDQGGPDRTSIACVDEVQLKVSK